MKSRRTICEPGPESGVWLNALAVLEGVEVSMRTAFAALVDG